MKTKLLKKLRRKYKIVEYTDGYFGFTISGDCILRYKNFQDALIYGVHASIKKDLEYLYYNKYKILQIKSIFKF